MQNIKTEEFFCGNEVIIEKVKKYNDLSYLLIPVLEELKEAYRQKLDHHASWLNVSVEEVAELIDELDKKKGMAMESEIMKRAIYLIEFDLWTKVMVLLNIGE